MTTRGLHLILGSPDSPEQRRFLGERFKWVCLAGSQLVLLAIVVPLVDDPGVSDLQAVPCAVLGVLIVSFWFVATPLSMHHGPKIWPWVMVVGVTTGIVMPVLAGSGWASFTVFAPVFIAGGSHVFFGGRQAWPIGLAVIGCFVGGMAIVGGSDALPGTIVASGITVGVAYILDHVIDRLAAASAAERAAREAADAALDELSEASAGKSAFLARVSHELRTPLNAVLGFSGMIHEGVAGPLSVKQADYIDEVVASGQHLLALVDDVLHLSRVETGTDDLLCRRFELSGLVERGVALFRDQAVRKSVGLETAVPAGVSVVADERKLRQVVFNLVSNAVKFTPTGGTVTVALRRAGDEVVVTVADTGPGIADDQHDLVFEPYRQAPTEGATGGTGLGLAVARRYVELHGGTLQVRSGLGEGATFEARLPVDASGVGPAGADAGSPDRRAEDEYRRTRSDLIRALSRAVAVASTVIVGVIALFVPPSRPGALVPCVVTCALLVALALAFHRGRDRVLGTPAAHLQVASVSAAVVAISASAGSVGEFVAPAYAWVALCAVALFGRGWAYVHCAFGAVGILVMMLLADGFTSPWLRAELVVAMGLTLAGVVAPLVGQVQDLLRSEAEARSTAERAAVAVAAATRHKSEFVATMSHELRTPLNAIIGFSEALREEVFGPITLRQAEYLDDILEADQHLLALVNDVLDLAKLDAGRMPEPRSEVRVDALVDGSVAALHRLGIPGTPVVDVAGALPAVPGDIGALTRVLTELLAWVADRSLGSADSVRLQLLSDDGGVRITVSGPASASVDVVDAFAEFPSGPADARRGTGLGMALAERQVRRHGGRCEVGTAAGVVAVTAWLPGVATPRPTSRLLHDTGVQEVRR